MISIYEEQAYVSYNPELCVKYRTKILGNIAHDFMNTDNVL